MLDSENLFAGETIEETNGKNPFALVLAKFVDYTKEKKALDKRLATVKAEMGTLEEIILEEFENLGVSSMRCGDTTVHLRRQLWARAKDGDKDTVCEVLRDLEMGDMVSETFNTNTLSAWVRERDKAGEEIPAALKDVLAITEEFSIRANMA